MLSTYAGQTPLSLVKDDRDDLKEFLLLYLADIQGNPSKPWPFGGYDQVGKFVAGLIIFRQFILFLEEGGKGLTDATNSVWIAISDYLIY